MIPALFLDPGGAKMFPRAPVKRFNEQVNDTPAPGAYDVKELATKGELYLLCTTIGPL